MTLLATRAAKEFFARFESKVLREERVNRFRYAAMRTVFPHQALRQHADHRRANHVRRNADFEEPNQGARGVVRVQGAEHQMPRERALNGDPARFKIAHFADHDHVRVVP